MAEELVVEREHRPVIRGERDLEALRHLRLEVFVAGEDIAARRQEGDDVFDLLQALLQLRRGVHRLDPILLRPTRPLRAEAVLVAMTADVGVELREAAALDRGRVVMAEDTEGDLGPVLDRPLRGGLTDLDDRCTNLFVKSHCDHSFVRVGYNWNGNQQQRIS